MSSAYRLGFYTSTWLFGLLIAIWFSICSVCGSDCSDRDQTAFSSSSSTIEMPYNFLLDDDTGYGSNLYCTIAINSYYDEDGVRLTFKDVDMQEPSTRGVYNTYTCGDRVEVYDGPDDSAPLVATACGTNYLRTIESTGSNLFVVFRTDSKNWEYHRGFTIEYESIDRGGGDYGSSLGLGAGTIAAIIIPSLLVYGCLFFIAYRRCKYAQQVRRNLAATGHTPEDMRMAVINMTDQASRGPLRPTNNNNSSNGGNNVNINDVLLQHMDASRDQRLGRVRHPAGDNSSLLTDDNTLHRHVDGNEHARPTAPYRVEDDDAALHLPMLPNSRGPSPVMFTIGNERSRSPRRGSPIPPGNPRHHHPLVDDQRSRGSGRSHHRREERGMVDDHAGSRMDANGAPTYSEHENYLRPSHTAYHEPPPSYEEAATGRYSPRPNKDGQA